MDDEVGCKGDAGFGNPFFVTNDDHSRYLRLHISALLYEQKLTTVIESTGVNYIERRRFRFTLNFVSHLIFY